MEFFQSGYIMYRDRKIGIAWSGQNAEHVMEEHQKMPSLHPFTHVKIQQLAKRVKKWAPKGGKRFEGIITAQLTGVTVAVIADIYPKFALLISAIKQAKPGI